MAYAPSNDDTKQIGSIIDFEKVGSRSPKTIRPGQWMVDDAIGSTWGYTDGMTVSAPETIIARLVDTVSKGGTYLLNIAPMADGTIPQAQQDTLLGIGKWLEVNGEAIYGTKPWVSYGEGDVDAKGAQSPTRGIRFNRKGDTLYAILLDHAQTEVTIAALGASAGKIKRVEGLGLKGQLVFSQDANGLTIKLPAGQSVDAFRIGWKDAK